MTISESECAGDGLCEGTSDNLGENNKRLHHPHSFARDRSLLKVRLRAHGVAAFL